ncbi:MAG: hypothetical protein AAFU79_05890, partial [Myxococcota bacterium]
MEQVPEAKVCRMDVSVALTNPEKGVSAEMHLGEAALEDLLRGHLYMDGLGKRLTVRLEYAAGAGCRMQKGFEDLGLI